MLQLQPCRTSFWQKELAKTFKLQIFQAVEQMADGHKAVKCIDLIDRFTSIRLS